MTRLFFTVLLFLGSSQALAGYNINVCNQLSNKIWFSQGYQEGGKVATKGWTELQANHCQQVYVGSAEFYLHAEVDDKNSFFMGDKSLCTKSPDGFFIEDAEGTCTGEGERPVGFKIFNVASHSRVNITQDGLHHLLKICNKMSFKTFAARGYLLDGQIITRGWWGLEPANCSTAWIPHTQESYVSANGGSWSWSGQGPSLCVNATNAFNYPAAETACDQEGDEYRKFHAVKLNANNEYLFELSEENGLGPQAELCNDSAAKIWVATAYRGQGESNITSQGFWSIEAQKCLNLKLVDGDLEELYLFGRKDDQSGIFVGDFDVCMNEFNKFEFADATTRACEGGGERRFPMIKVPIANGRAQYRFSTARAARGKLEVCNDFEKKIWVTFAMWDSFSNGKWMTHGWNALEPMSCTSVRTYASKAYVWASTFGEEPKIWEGDKEFCSNDRGYRYYQAYARPCTAEKDKTRKFIAVPLSEGTTTYRFD